MKKLKVGIIGCGTIGSGLAKFLVKKFSDVTDLVYLCDVDQAKALRIKWDIAPVAQVVLLDRLIRGSDLIIEAAGAAVSAEIVRKALSRNKQVLVMSVGGLIDSDLPRLLRKTEGKLWIPSGALAGVDALLAAHEGQIRRVRLRTRKPPSGLRGAPFFKKNQFPRLSGNREVCVFRGRAFDALKGFPQNINVSAVLSLAGIGARRTQVEIWTSKAYRFNEHDILIEGDFGKIQTVTQNVPSKENPKTSYLAILSAAATLKKAVSSAQIGT